MINKTHIGILGCGWLGKPLAEALIKKNYKVKGTTTSPEKLHTLQTEGIEAFLIELKPGHISSDFQVFLQNLEVLVMAIPPQLENEDNALLKALEYAFEHFNFSSIKKMIYVSSTGVFSDGVNKIYDENSEPNNNSFRGKGLEEIENFIGNQRDIPQVSILRYGGLIENGGRHPVHYLSGRNNIKNPKAPVNLIELKDAVNLLVSIIETKEMLPIYHGIYPKHPTREDYYVEKANALNIEPPEFIGDTISRGKTILSEKTQTELNFRFESEI